MKKLILLAALLVFASCGDKPADNKGENKGPTPEIKGVFTTEKIADGKKIRDAKKTAKEGDTIVVSGVVGGEKKVFGEKIATFYVCDDDLKACNEGECDGCETPWDFCCAAKEDLKASTATVKFIDKDGKALRFNVKGQGGLKELSKVTVKGKVAKGSKDGALIIIAEAIHVEADKKK